MGPISYLVVGFGPSEQHGSYVQCLRQELVGRPVEAQTLGSVTIKTLSSVRQYFDFMRASNVIFELTSCRRVAGDNLGDYLRYIASMVNYAISCGVRIGFLNLPRKVVEGEEDVLDRAIQIIAKECGAPSVSAHNLMLVDEMRALLRDGVHTTPEGSVFYSKLASDLVVQMRSSGLPKPIKIAEKSIVPSFEGVFSLGVYDDIFERKGFSFPVKKISEGKHVDVLLPAEFSVSGMLAVAGPRSGAFLITSELGEEKILQPYDADCHYSRIVELSLPFKGRKLRIFQKEGRPSVKLKKGEPDEKGRLGQLLGFIGDRLTV